MALCRLARGPARTVAPGPSTVHSRRRPVHVLQEEGVLQMLTLGDCGMVVVREGEGVVFRAEVSGRGRSGLGRMRTATSQLVQYRLEQYRLEQYRHDFHFAILSFFAGVRWRVVMRCSRMYGTAPAPSRTAVYCRSRSISSTCRTRWQAPTSCRAATSPRRRISTRWVMRVQACSARRGGSWWLWGGLGGSNTACNQTGNMYLYVCA